jgi:hypothetical protein
MPVTRTALLLLVVGLALAPARSSAQSTTVRTGADLYMEADFEGALTTLEGALEDETLSLADVELALDRMAAARLAIGDSAGLERTLGWLAAIAPSHVFGPDVPTDLSAQFLSILAHAVPVTATLRAEPGAERGEIEVRAAVRGDAFQVVQRVTLTCADDAHRRDAEGDAPSVMVSDAASCDAVATGPGGIELARAHREGTSSGISSVAAPVASSDPDPLVLGLGIGGGVIGVGLIVGIIVGVVVSGNGAASGGALSGPTIRW